MNKIYLSGNYVIVEKDGNVYEYPRTLSVYTIQGSNYVIKERIDDGQFVLPIADIGTYFDEAGAVAYTEATLVTFLRENTGFKTAGGGSPATEFIISVKTDNPGISASDSFIIPTSVGTYNYDVDWGDGNFSANVTSSVQHTYASAGTYTIKISGIYPRIAFNNSGDKDKVLEIQNWGNIAWSSFYQAFRGCSNLELTATDVPDLSLVTSLNAMFRDCIKMVGNTSMNNWDVSTITDMREIFRGASLFNQNIGNWNVGNVNDVYYMFAGAVSFNNGGSADINNWNVSNVVTQLGMFLSTPAFNQPLNNWDVSNMLSFSNMFAGSGFNQDIGSWNTSNCTNMGNMFLNNSVFNQDISSWDTSNVTSMYQMFNGSTSFNQDISSWNVSNVVGNGFYYFSRLSGLNANLSSWQLNTAITDCRQMLRNQMSTENYTDTLVSFANQVFVNGGPLNVNFISQSGRTFDTSRSGGLNFATAGDARTYLTTATPTGAGWTISGDIVI